jgi:hypothetical protein
VGCGTWPSRRSAEDEEWAQLFRRHNRKARAGGSRARSEPTLCVVRRRGRLCRGHELVRDCSGRLRSRGR